MCPTSEVFLPALCSWTGRKTEETLLDQVGVGCGETSEMPLQTMPYIAAFFGEGGYSYRAAHRILHRE